MSQPPEKPVFTASDFRRYIIVAALLSVVFFTCVNVPWDTLGDRDTGIVWRAIWEAPAIVVGANFTYTAHVTWDLVLLELLGAAALTVLGIYLAPVLYPETPEE